MKRDVGSRCTPHVSKMTTLTCNCYSYKIKLRTLQSFTFKVFYWIFIFFIVGYAVSYANPHFHKQVPGDRFTKVIVNRKSKITLTISLRARILAFH